MFKKHRKIKKTALFSGLLIVPFAASFFLQYKPPLKDEVLTPVEQPLSDKQKVLSSLLDIHQFNVDAHIDLIRPAGGDQNKKSELNLDIKAKGDLSNLEDIKLQGDITLGLGTVELNAHLGYFSNNIFFDYNESYFKLESTKLLDFVGMLPSKFDLAVEIPTEISDIDISQFTEYLDNMGDKELQDDGTYFFALPLSEQIVLKIVTDSELRFSGIKTDLLSYNDMLFQLDVDLERVENLEFTDPTKDTAILSKYADFSPALKLFDGLFNLTQKKKNTINVDLDIDNKQGEEFKNFVNANLDLIYDLESEKHLFAFDGNINVDKKVVDKETEEVSYVPHSTPFSIALYDNTAYTHIGNVALSVTNESLTNVINYVMSQISDETVSELIDGLSNSFSNIDVDEIINKVSNTIGEFTLTQDELSLALYTSNFSREANVEEKIKAIDISDTTFTIKFDENSGDLKKISISDLVINDYRANVTLSFESGYRDFQLDSVEYESIDHLVPSLVSIYDLNKDRNKFRLEFDATVKKDDEMVDGVLTTYNDVTVNGGLQFELDPQRYEEGHSNVGYGYGNVDIVDRKNVKHHIYADMKSVDELLMAYSTVTNTSRDAGVDPMYVKMKVQTMKDIMNLVVEIVREQDEHFKEIAGKLFETLGSMPILDIIDEKAYNQILAYTLINSFEAGEDFIELGLSLDILAIENVNVKVRLGFVPKTFEENIDGETSTYTLNVLDSLHVSGFEYNGLSLEFNAYLREFKDSLASTRLSKGNSYIDFSDLKVLLRLGINTSKNNYYHFNSTATVTLSLFSISIELPLDIKVWTKKGDVHVSIDFTSIPVNGLAAVAIGPRSGYNSVSERSASIYYHSGYFYIKGNEVAKQGGFLGIGAKTRNVEYTAKYNTSDFFDNILTILLGDVLVLRDTFMNQINDAISDHDDPNYQMKYEKILKNFAYNASGHYFYFDVDLAEIANNTDLKSFTATIRTDDTNTNLSGVDVDLKVELAKILGAAISINVSASINLTDCALVADDTNRLYALEACEASMADKASGYTNTRNL